ncbi:hypothetical protein ACV3RS_14780 [Clostridium perfringens]
MEKKYTLQKRGGACSGTIEIDWDTQNGDKLLKGMNEFFVQVGKQ